MSSIGYGVETNVMLPEFEEKYPDFAGLAFDFSDPPPGHTSDDFTARNIRRDLPADVRIDIFRRLIADSERLLLDMNVVWQTFSDYTNRTFDGPESARRWLTPLVTAWQEEMRRLQNEPNTRP